MLWINQWHLWIALGATIFLMLSHALSSLFSRYLPREGGAFISFAGGVSVAYVFLDMLPNLVEYNKPIGSFLLSMHWLTSFTELLIYWVALVGFLLYYGFDVLALRYENKTHNNGLVYALHVGMFSMYNALITYTMSLRAQAGLTYIILFTFAMSLHFVLTDRKFSRMYPNRFNHWGRSLLNGALLGGWFCSVVFDPVNVLVAALMMAFLAGSILLNVFNEELPNSSFARYPYFVMGALLISILLLLQTWILKTTVL